MRPLSKTDKKAVNKRAFALQLPDPTLNASMLMYVQNAEREETDGTTPGEIFIRNLRIMLIVADYEPTSAAVKEHALPVLARRYLMKKQADIATEMENSARKHARANDEISRREMLAEFLYRHAITGEEMRSANKMQKPHGSVTTDETKEHFHTSTSNDQSRYINRQRLRHWLNEALHLSGGI